MLVLRRVGQVSVAGALAIAIAGFLIGTTYLLPKLTPSSTHPEFVP